MHSTVAGSGNIASMVEAARQIGFDCLEPEYHQLYDYLDAGYPVENLKSLLAGFDLPGVGWLCDIERQGDDFSAFLDESSKLFELCGNIGIKGVQILTGPVDYRAVSAFKNGMVFDGYMGLLNLDLSTQMKLTQVNMCKLADAAAEHDVILYLEPLCWTPIGSILQGRQLIETAGRPNLRLVVDFWHCFVAGDRPEDIARIPKEMIYGVHICDSLEPGDDVPDENVLRAVRLGEGVIKIKEWVDAVKSTGYDGWWACEVFDKKQNQLALSESAARNHFELTKLVR